MRVLFVHDNVFLTQGERVYSDTFTYTYLKRYLDLFSEVTVVARSKEIHDAGSLPLASGEGIRFIFLESISTLRSFFGLRGKHRKMLRNLLGEYDAVIARVPSELGMMAAGIARETDTKCLVEVVGCAWSVMWYYGGVRSKIYAPYFYYQTKSTVRKAKYASYVTDFFLQKRYPASKAASTLSVSDVLLAEMDDEVLEKRVEKIRKMKGTITLGTIGVLEIQYKGIDLALSTLSGMEKEGFDFEYRIAGPGSPEKYQKQADELRIADKVFFDGSIRGGEKIFEWLDDIDVYLHPSLAEGLPRAVIEAMSRACPAIGSSVGGIPELLDDEMLFDHSKPERFAAIIQTLVSDKEKMIHAAKRNFQVAQEYQPSILDAKRTKFWIKFREG